MLHDETGNKRCREATIIITSSDQDDIPSTSSDGNIFESSKVETYDFEETDRRSALDMLFPKTQLHDSHAAASAVSLSEMGRMLCAGRYTDKGPAKIRENATGG